jgi:hypothetical protein
MITEVFDCGGEGGVGGVKGAEEDAERAVTCSCNRATASSHRSSEPERQSDFASSISRSIPVFLLIRFLVLSSSAIQLVRRGSKGVGLFGEEGRDSGGEPFS